VPLEGERMAARVAVERRVQLAALLISAGLLVLLITLIRIHPLAFVAFAVIGCPLVLAGILVFLYAIISQETNKPMGPKAQGGAPGSISDR